MNRLKKLTERRGELQAKMEELLKTADTENRALTEEEGAQFDAAEQEIRSLDETIAREERARKLEKTTPEKQEENEQEAAEERAFVDYVLGRATEMRAGEQNMTMENNGAIIPSSIANRIIKAVEDRCPILQGAIRYNVRGSLIVPVWGKANKTHDITVGYQEEFTELVADTGAFSGIKLDGYLSGALALIGRRLENNGSFSVTNFIINQMAEKIDRKSVV